MKQSIAFLRLARNFFQSDLWMVTREFSEAEAWLDMLQLAAYETQTRCFSGHAITLNPGDIVGSIRFLGSRWAWSKNRVARFLITLRDAKRIEFWDADGTANRVIRLCNWGLYNARGDPNGTETGTAAGQERDKVKELKNDSIKEASTRLMTRACSGGTDTEKADEEEFMRLLESVCGEDERRKNGGLWRNRYRDDGKKCWRVMREAECVKRERPATIRKGIAQFAMDLWKRFK